MPHHRIQDWVVVLVGVTGLAWEAFGRDGTDPTLLIAFVAMIGLPAMRAGEHGPQVIEQAVDLVRPTYTTVPQEWSNEPDPTVYRTTPMSRPGDPDPYYSGQSSDDRGECGRGGRPLC